MRRRSLGRLGAVALLGTLVVAPAREGAPVGPESETTILCPATRDVWLSAYDGEQSFNMGAATQLKLKQWQEFALVDFDLSALAGRRVTGAALVVTPVGRARLGLNGGSDLRWLSVSTVSHDWVEGRSKRYAEDWAGNGATFLESSFGRHDWGWPGSRVWDVILGNGNTLRFDGVLEPAVSASTREQVLRIVIDPRLVHALAAGASHGLLLMEGSTDVGTNSFIASRESGRGPYLELRTAPAGPAPDRPGDLAVRPAPGRATPTSGALEVSLSAPAGAFSYDVRLDGEPVARWQVPFPRTVGTRQTFHLLDLAPGRELTVEVVAVGPEGALSRPASIVARSSGVLRAPLLPSPLFQPRGGDPPRLDGASVWALPELTRVDPVSGAVLGERSAAATQLRRRNPVWDASTRTVRLAAARGEIVGFQVVLEGRVRDATIVPSPLRGGASGTVEIGPDRFRLWRTWYVGTAPEYALPLAGAFEVPSPDNGVQGQSLQAVSVDLHVPAAVEAGTYRGGIVVAGAGGRVPLDLEVLVYDVILPDVVGFGVELNTYEGPGLAGSPRFRESFRLAHYHRATINRVPYSHRGDVHPDWAPRLDPGGRVVDWSGFDRRLGGLLDGSWFTDNPRAGVPVPVLYLPLFEGWPLDFRRHYSPGADVPIDAVDPLAKLRHDTLAPPLAEALDAGFREAFSAAVASFLGHAEEKRWNRTLFQVYLNNKPRYGYTLWTLDEPFEYLDWAALRTFARLTREGLSLPEAYSAERLRAIVDRSVPELPGGEPVVLFRADVSRPMWMGSLGDGLFNALYVSSDTLPMRRLLRGLEESIPALLFAYGTPPPVTAGGWSPVAWCLEAWSAHAEGVLPWQSLAGEEALWRPVDTGLLIDGGRYGRAVASLRLHALRRGAQDVELLRLLERRNGWTREQSAYLVALALGRGDPLPPEPAWRESETLRAADFLLLKEAVLQLLAPQPVSPP